MKKEFFVERQGQRFVLYAGLLDEAHEQGLKSITTSLLQIPTEENRHIAICQAVVEMQDGKNFSGIGDASPANVSRPMQTAIIRMAETRAKARALRDAVNVGAAALEELDGGDHQDNASDFRTNTQPQRARLVNGNGNANPNPTRPIAVAPAPMPTVVQDEGLATEKQLQAIHNLAYKRLFMSEEELQGRVQKSFGIAVEKLTRGDASQLIRSLNENVA